MRILVSLIGSLALLTAVACGGSQKSETEAPPADPAAMEPTAVAPETDPATGTDPAAPAEGAAAGGDVATTCDALCQQILTCAEEASGKSATDQEHEQFMQGCKDTCVTEPAEKLTQAQTCINQADGNCQELFPCLETIE